ncbi:LytB protein [Candidatus Omnitrophus magneticus]|uniref:4-hydroxy-3-methylbut-2-enyl diphosphate reductase n=1 Tax=Candidatus Omnitrophus magneticus TaxID=1609969 RepID=A0A0F0CVL7_9BACT|nr:LytB protein [Candidatus Omnitrophus magneticus]
MKINIAKSSGFCFGVRRAIEISLKAAKKINANVYVLGDIVHNNFVVNELNMAGVKRFSKIYSAKNKNSYLIISAHGAGKKIFSRAINRGYKIIDATCPRVKDIYKIGRRLERKNKIIIIGDKGHSEVKGIAGQLKNRALIIEEPGVLPNNLAKIKKAVVITQSTQSLDNINAIMGKLVKIIPDIKLYDTTCRITRVKQEEIRTLPKNNDAVLIVGSKSSANTKRLYLISKAINKNTYWIETAQNLNLDCFNNVKSIAIMAGASTPDKIVKEIVSVLEKYSRE